MLNRLIMGRDKMVKKIRPIFSSDVGIKIERTKYKTRNTYTKGFGQGVFRDAVLIGNPKTKSGLFRWVGKKKGGKK